jgi:hypothetical protein
MHFLMHRDVGLKKGVLQIFKINLNHHIFFFNFEKIFIFEIVFFCPPMEDLSDVKLIRADTTL